MRTIMIILIFAFIALQGKLWFGDGGILQWIDLKNKMTTQTQENEKLAVRNRAIGEEIIALKRSDEALEEQARYELGMIKNDEVYYQFVD